jgi:hypothetical protein
MLDENVLSVLIFSVLKQSRLASFRGQKELPFSEKEHGTEKC